MKNPAVYILASKKNGTLYIGVTSDLPSEFGNIKTIFQMDSLKSMMSLAWCTLSNTSIWKVP